MTTPKSLTATSVNITYSDALPERPKALYKIENTAYSRIMIIDTHVHFGKMLTFDLAEKTVLDSMDKYNIDFSLVSNINATEGDFDQKPLPTSTQTSQQEVLRQTIKFVKAHKDRLCGLAWIKPYHETLSKDFVALYEDNMDYLCGLKVHPYHSMIDFDDEKIFPYIEFAQEKKIPFVTHTGNGKNDNVKKVYEVAKKFPTVDFVMVHMGLGTDNQEAIKYILELPNLYGDTTWVRLENSLALIKNGGSDKIMFGSDMPIDGLDTYAHNPKGERSVYQDYFEFLAQKASKAETEKLFYKNAKKLFKLNAIT